LHSLSEKHFFNSTFELPKGIEFISISCQRNNNNINNNQKEVYRNIHAVIRRKQEAQKILKSVKAKERHLNVLMFGIDSVSRLHFLRSLPETRKYLKDSGWFTLEGYNKVRFQNLFIIFTNFTFLRSTITLFQT
jgi:hypothetical protein